METITEKTSKALKELIIINNDRYDGYKTASKETDDIELKTLFEGYSQQSKQFSNELQELLPERKYAPEDGRTKVSGKLYRVFMDVKNAMKNKDRKGILSSCEFGEDIAKKTYDDEMENSSDMEQDIMNILKKQREELQKSHDNIKSLRDSA